MLILWIMLFSVLGSVGAIVTAAIFLLLEKRIKTDFISCLVAYATGTLLAAAFLGLIPNALMYLSPLPILSTILVGIILFFSLEKLVIWRHCHDMECEAHSAAGPMILIGDAFHNLIDGIIIAASFIISIPLGIIVGLSVIAHEIPQEVGDFGILLHGGYSKRRALSLNLLSSISTIPAAIIAYYALDIVRVAIPYVMAISAASFLYIALSDLTPELHTKVGVVYAFRQFFLVLAGVGTIILVLRV
ncbi:MAG: ZIP family metal transporter, partial [Promethearchaeota archaeon]